MNLENLTPAPWAVTGLVDELHIVGDYESKDHWDTWIAHMTQDDGQTDAAFIALARNAFDVMMRRGWANTRQFHADGKITWGADFCRFDPKSFFEFSNLPHANSFDDPFTALVEADKWYLDNVEKSK